MSEADQVTLCTDCQYCGDKFSFQIPNNLPDVDPQNPLLKRYYCCCGDCERYGQDITGKIIVSCKCFEKL